MAYFEKFLYFHYKVGGFYVQSFQPPWTQGMFCSQFNYSMIHTFNLHPGEAILVTCELHLPGEKSCRSFVTPHPPQPSRRKRTCRAGCFYTKRHIYRSCIAISWHKQGPDPDPSCSPCLRNKYWLNRRNWVFPKVFLVIVSVVSWFDVLPQERKMDHQKSSKCIWVGTFR